MYGEIIERKDSNLIPNRREKQKFKGENQALFGSQVTDKDSFAYSMTSSSTMTGAREKQESHSNQQQLQKSSKSSKGSQRPPQALILMHNHIYVACELVLSLLTYFILFVNTIEIFFGQQVASKEITDSLAIRRNFLRNGYDGRFFWDSVCILALIADGILPQFDGKWAMKLGVYTRLVSVLEFDKVLNADMRIRRKTRSAYLLIRLYLIAIFVSNILGGIFYRNGIDNENEFGVDWLDDIPYAQAEDTFQLRYLYSIYWSITTLSGVVYGDIAPTNPAEVIVAMFDVFFVTGFLGYIIDSIFDIVPSLHKGEANVRGKMRSIARYMRDKNIKEKVQSKVEEFLQYKLIEEKERNKETETTLLNMLPSHIKAELFYEMHTFFFKKFQWSSQFSDPFISALSFEIEELNLLEDGTLYEPSFVDNDESISLYFVAKGSIEIVQDIPEMNRGYGFHLNVVKENSFIGLYQFISGTLIKEVLRSTTQAKVFIIPRKKFLQTIADFPQDLSLYKSFEDRILKEKEYEYFGLYCYNCLSANHVIQECEFNTRTRTLLDIHEHKISSIKNRTNTLNLIHEDPLNGSELDDSNHEAVSSSALNRRQKLKEEMVQSLSSEANDVISYSALNDIKKMQRQQQMRSMISQENNNTNTIMESQDEDDVDMKLQHASLQGAFLKVQEQILGEHLKHEVYNENEENKWHQRGRVKEHQIKRIELQNKLGMNSTISNDLSNKKALANNVLLQIVNGIKTVLDSNSIDINQIGRGYSRSNSIMKIGYPSQDYRSASRNMSIEVQRYSIRAQSMIREKRQFLNPFNNE